jgi:membrane protein
MARCLVEDELLTRSAALSYYFIFTLFPMLFSLLSLLGLFAQSNDFRADLVQRFGHLMPSIAVDLVRTTVREISVYSSRWKVALGLLITVWSGSSGMSCIMDALNRSFRMQESRPFWKRELISFGLTAAISGLILAALVIVFAGSTVAEFVGGWTGLSQATISLWELAEWPIALVSVFFALALIYYFGPDIRQPWRWITPGSLAAVAVWIAASLFFRQYVRFFGAYSRSYGSLGAVMVLLLWLYIAGLAILLGGEINAEIVRTHESEQPLGDKL